MVSDKANLEVPGVAHHLSGSAGYVQILRHHELDALDQHIPADREAVSRNGHRLHPALILHSVLIHLCENDGQRNPLAGADIFHRHIQLDDSAQRL